MPHHQPTSNSNETAGNRVYRCSHTCLWVRHCEVHDADGSPAASAAAVLHHQRAIWKCHLQHRPHHPQAILLIRLIFRFLGRGAYRRLASLPQRHGLHPGRPPACRSLLSQISYTYSKCSDEGVRFLAHYYNTPCRLGFPLPPNVPNLPCAVSCGSGSFLQPGAAACRYTFPRLNDRAALAALTRPTLQHVQGGNVLSRGRQALGQLASQQAACSLQNILPPPQRRRTVRAR